MYHKMCRIYSGGSSVCTTSQIVQRYWSRMLVRFSDGVGTQQIPFIDLSFRVLFEEIKEEPGRCYVTNCTSLHHISMPVIREALDNIHNCFPI